MIDLVGNHKACLYKPQLLQTQLTRPPTHANRAMPLAAGCFINLDPKLLPLLALLKKQQKPTLIETYQTLKEHLGYRPTARQTWAVRLGEQLRFDTQKQVHRGFPGKAALIFRKKYSESLNPYAMRFITLILLFTPSSTLVCIG